MKKKKTCYFENGPEKVKSSEQKYASTQEGYLILFQSYLSANPIGGHKLFG